MRNFVRGLMLVTLVFLASGCSRARYRLQADRETYGAIEEKAEGAAWSLPPFDIAPSADSRMFDPFNPDKTPLPPDDPASHQLMHCVDGKNGYPHWLKHGAAGGVETTIWQDSLPRDDDGNVVLDIEATVRIGMLNSRDYQRELEELYLSALDVTFERFRFDSQFFAGTGTNFRADGAARPGGGGNSASRLSQDTAATMRRLSTTGGELVVGLANSLVWQFSGPNTDTATTVLDFSLVQPLLRFGGRAVVLERLTQSERTLLANVRQMEQFRQGFFVEVVTGRNSGDGPNRRGPVGAAGLGLMAGVPSGRAGVPDANGVIGVLQDQVLIRNQEANVAALRDSYAQLDAAFDAGRVPNRLQVDQARQALLNGQSSLLTTKAAYQTNLDTFKISLGLPPSLNVKFDAPFLARFDLIDPRLTQLQVEISDVLETLRDPERGMEISEIQAELKRLLELREPVEAQWKIADEDWRRLEAQIPRRKMQLKDLRERPEVREGRVDPYVYSETTFTQRVQRLRESLPELRGLFDEIWNEIEVVSRKIAPLPIEDARQEVRGVSTKLSGLLLEMSLDQAAMRLESITLERVRLDEQTALNIACERRLDWMNARARLVDWWRQMEIEANSLKSDLALTFSGDIQNRGDNPMKFRANTGRLRMGVEFDTPLTRLAERNAYRESQIEYQRARRDFMLFEDRISQSLRNTLRITELAQLNFELRRQAVRVAVSQVGQTRLRLNQPPRPGDMGQLGATTARDLVSALSDLLSAQNEFLNVWVGYEVLRIVLLFELGALELDERGIWVNPGPIEFDADERMKSVEPVEEEIPPGISR